MKKQIILSFLLWSLLFVSGTLPGQAQETNDLYAIIVELTFDEQDLDTAIDLLLEAQMLTLENEEGCVVYDVLLSKDVPNTLFLYESYESEKAYKIHESSSHYKTIIVNKLTPLIKKSRTTKVVPLNLQDDLMDEEM